MKIDPHVDKFIYVKKSPVHGKGCYAREDIVKGEYLGEYAGPTARKDGTYVLWIFEEDGKSYGVNGKNQLMYLNHSSRFNAKFDGTSLYTTKKIKKDQEVFIHYGEEWENVE